MTMERLLVLVRHGQSEWNLKNLFTGWKNPDLTPVGVEEAKKAGKEIGKQDNFGRLQIVSRVKNREFMSDFTYTLRGLPAVSRCQLLLAIAMYASAPAWLA